MFEPSVLFPFHHLNINLPDILGISSIPTFIIVKERLIELLQYT